MFSTPNSVVRAARAALAVLFVLFAGIAVGPLADLARLSPVHGAAAMFAATFVSLTLAMAALPWHRKGDLLTAAMALAVTFALIRFGLNRGSLIAESVGGILGALAAFAPVGVEQVRRRSREYGDVLFEVIEIEDRRRRRRPGSARRRKAAREAVPASSLAADRNG